MNTTATLLPVPVPALEVVPMMPERVNALLRGVLGKIIGCRLFHHVRRLEDAHRDAMRSVRDRF